MASDRPETAAQELFDLIKAQWFDEAMGGPDAAEIVRLIQVALNAGLDQARAREAHLLSVIRGYNPDDALFDHEKESNGG